VPVDLRFFASLGALTLGEIAELTGAALHGDPDIVVNGISPAATARRGELAFLDGDGKTTPQLSDDLNAVIVNAPNVVHVPKHTSYLLARTPRHAHGVAAQALFKPRHLDWQGGDRIAASAQVHPAAVIGPGVVIGADAAIGEATVIGPNAIIGPGVQIGRHAHIGAGASVFCALLGDHVKLLAGARIGEAGFGVAPGTAGVEDTPHFGRVILQDHVTIGANSCVDRGVFDDTIVGERTKIDNLCQVAHNVVFGRSVLMAAFGGISGSVTIGDGTVMGGQVGIADHVKIGSNTRLAAASGIFRDVPDGETWGGAPAKPLLTWMREIAWVQKHAHAKKKPAK
jgi:UDP-3-O-[3-hydroxymyristoyl] glucosamine N-acyltransferase